MPISNSFPKKKKKTNPPITNFLVANISFYRNIPPEDGEQMSCMFEFLS